MTLLFAALSLLQPQEGIEARVNATLAKLTLEQKLEIIGGIRDFYIHGYPELGIPELKMSDGPAGVRNYGPTTAYPAPVSLAASWDTELARKYGEAIGTDARARGVHIWLGPGVNLARIPQNGRNFEYFGEDPFLSGKTAAQVVRGVQSKGVVATVKHFAANDHEDDRQTDNSIVDERVLRELYLKPFEIAVKDGGAWAVMTGYNLLNGSHCSENDWLVNQVLKKDWGFKGIMMSDWGGTHSALPAALAGLDLEMPSGKFMNAENLSLLVSSGKLPVAVLDDKVRRILRMSFAMGFPERVQEIKTIPKDDPQNAALALQIAREGMVLLRNENHCLPLDAKKIHKIVVIEPFKLADETGGGGSAFTTPVRSESLIEALKKVVAPGVSIENINVSSPIDVALKFNRYLSPIGTEGLSADYFNGTDLQGLPAFTQSESKIDHDWGQKSPGEGIGADNFSVRWSGNFKADASGPYLLVTRSDDGIRVFIDGQKVLDDWSDHGAQTKTATISLEAGKTYRLKVEYYEKGGDAVAQFGLAPLAGYFENQVHLASLKNADAIIVRTGFDKNTEGEGHDRSFQLPDEQLMFVRRACALNKHTIVVNTSGAGVDMIPWISKTGAVLQAWYPGQNGFQAVAEILFGKTNPSGHLPTTFPGSLKGTYYEKAYPAINHQMAYREGLFMGYRSYGHSDKEPLFPFGFGLSFTTFGLSGLRINTTENEAVVSVLVKNTGDREGATVVQAYLGLPETKILRAERELKAFQRVNLKAGQSKRISLTIPRSAAAYWNVQSHAWTVEPGNYQLSVGLSSRELPLTARWRLR